MSAPTPPWNVDAWDLAADLSKIEQQWGPIRAILQDPARFDLRHPPTSGWGCGEHAGHVAIAAAGIARGIERALAEPERDRDQGPHEGAAAVLRSGVFARGSAKAPERLDPSTRSREELAAMASGAAAAWAALRQRADALAACPARFPHFLFGHLTSAEWVRFCAIHTAHHLGLVRDIAAAAGAEWSVEDRT